MPPKKNEKNLKIFVVVGIEMGESNSWDDLENTGNSLSSKKRQKSNARTLHKHIFNYVYKYLFYLYMGEPSADGKGRRFKAKKCA